MSHADPQGIISHISLGANDFEKSIRFYDKILPALGIKKVVEYPGATAYGKVYPELWIQTPVNGQPATVGNGSHVGFIAGTKEDVHRFHEAALNAGAKDEGQPGPREEYGPAYYGSFVIDPDGHKVEACYWDLDMIKDLYLNKNQQTNEAQG